MTEMICILCPVGCHLTIDRNLEVSGNKCSRGIKYAIEEITSPKRTLTTTLKTSSLTTPRLSVKSLKPLPKSLLFDVIDLLSTIYIKKDVKIGDVIVFDVLNTGIDIVATKNVVINSL